MIGRDGAAGLVCLAGSLLLLGASRGLPQPALVPIGPAFYPRILFVCTALLSAALVVVGLVSRRRRAWPPARYGPVVLAFAEFTAYVFLLPVLGYRLATALFVGVLQGTMDRPHGKRWLLLLAVAVATSLVTFVIFEGYLSVLLPRGRLTGF